MLPQADKTSASHICEAQRESENGLTRNAYQQTFGKRRFHCSPGFSFVLTQGKRSELRDR